MQQQNLVLKKVAVHNLKNVDIELQPQELIVFTGVSGSGKSSLAFDTIYVEGQRRYVESLSTFARRHMGDLTKPDVESVEGLSPTISIEQKTAGRNPRSTVGTMTEIYDYLRVFFARVATPFCPVSHEPVLAQSRERIIALIQAMPNKSRLMILAPYARSKKGEFVDDLRNFLKKGFLRARVDGRVINLDEEVKLDKNIAHDVDIVIDRISLEPDNMSRIAESVTQALEIGQGLMAVYNLDSEEEKLFSMHAYSVTSGLSYPPLEPQDFSFNSPGGMCPTCHGLGMTQEFDLNKVIDQNLSIAQDCCLVASSYKTVRYKNIYDNLARLYKFDIDTPFKDLSEKAKKVFLYGNNQKWTRMEFVHPTRPISWTDYIHWRGVLHEAKERYSQAKSAAYRKKMQQLLSESICPSCEGSRLKPYPSAARLNGKSIRDLSALTVADLHYFFQTISLSDEDLFIGKDLIREIVGRLEFLLEVGLHYLAIDRTSPTLSGGEAQRVRLASQIGSGLVGVTYVLDEPSIGLHPRDNTRLVKTLRHLRDMGNTVIVVEHDEETMLAADTVVDFGPGAGAQGGEIVTQGPLSKIIENPRSVTGNFLSGKIRIEIPKKRRKADLKDSLIIYGAAHHNLKNIDVTFPLHTFIAVTGVSGSGKSSLISEILYPLLSNVLHHGEHSVGKYSKFDGIENIDKVIAIDQSPIGRNPRSNPATYIKLFDEIRDLFSQLPESQARGFKPGRFSFNVKEGSCLHCHGMGMLRVDMDFMEDQWVTCTVCNNRRFDTLTLSITFKGKNIAEVLDMNVKEALEFFNAIPSIAHKLQVLMKVGLEYLPLGQPSPTLSGGEAQRIKLAKELARPSTGKTLYILDEPTTGLHFHDIKQLLVVLHELVDRGNTVLTIEHNMDVIKTADWIVDLGPEGGVGGGSLVAEGPPEKIAKLTSATGKALNKALFEPIEEQLKVALKEKKALKKNKPIESIIVKGAETHNLKRVDAVMPRQAITVCTGPSGSGKSSFAFDTVYAEGQRRYIESLSPYARQFVEQMPKSKVEQIEGLSPAIAIEQKAHAGNPRSTVGTMTEIYDYLRILYARAGTAYDPETGEEIKSISKDFVAKKLMSLKEGTPITILAPIDWQRGDDFQQLIQNFQKQGFLRIRLNKELIELDDPSISFDPKRKNQIELVVDRLKITPSLQSRLLEAIEMASSLSNGRIIVLSGKEEQLYFLSFAVESTGKSFPTITPHTFAFNVQEGMCPECQGLGYLYGAHFNEIEEFMLLSVEGFIATLFGVAGRRRLTSQESLTLDIAHLVLKDEKINLDLTLEELSKDKLHILMSGSQKWYYHKKTNLSYRWVGINTLFAKAGRSGTSAIKETLVPLLEEVTCYSCNGTRLNPLASHVEVEKTTLGNLCNMPAAKALEWIQKTRKKLKKEKLLDEVLAQLEHRLLFLVEVGLHYMAINRPAPTLSNGEAQRIRLARQLGSGLTGVLYVLDEPTIGLHPQDNQLLNQALVRLKDLGNTLLLVEHDPLTIKIADYILDFGPLAGEKGGYISARGTYKEICKNPNSLTGAYLTGKKQISVPKKRRSIDGDTLKIVKAQANNLKKLSVNFPIGTLCCLTGVSGSGKSTLMHQVIKPAVHTHLSSRYPKEHPIVKGIDHFQKMICVDQNPLGHTARSDVSTYCDLLDKMRSFYSAMPEAKVRGLKPRNFSYNHKKGMCTNCFGMGYKKISMQFLPPVTVVCDQCHGLKLNPLSLSIKYKEKSLGQILQMTVTEALVHFENHPRITKILNTLCDVGLEYLKLGQEIVTLSGGEAQRIKLCRELSKRSSVSTLYLLDEPTNGLHSEDIAKLLKILHRLADKGNTVIVIEHNLEVIKNADFICDIGPEAGEKGGEVVATGTPEEIAFNTKSKTGVYIKEALKL
ncbi:MAG: excinuclease ABC subunit UvrA [Parachlamydiales bacterium]|nr:excinuclease ABC subunit UvrA [Parachlamydiales bacterium]